MSPILGITASSWRAVNSYESIATTIVGAGGTTSVSFNLSGVTGYKHLQIRYSGFVSGDAFINFNSDTTSTYSRHSLYGTGSGTPSTYALANDVRIGFTYTSSNSNPGSAICDILDYTNTSKYKTVRVLNGDDQNGSGIIMLASGNWRSTSAITSIQITSSGFSQYSQFALYGIKG